MYHLGTETRVTEMATGYLGGVCIRSAGMMPDAWMKEEREAVDRGFQLRQLRWMVGWTVPKKRRDLRITAAPMDGSGGCVVMYVYVCVCIKSEVSSELVEMPSS